MTGGPATALPSETSEWSIMAPTTLRKLGQANPAAPPFLDRSGKGSFDLGRHVEELFDVTAAHRAMVSSALRAPGTSSVMSWTCTPTTSEHGRVAWFRAP